MTWFEIYCGVLLTFLAVDRVWVIWGYIGWRRAEAAKQEAIAAMLQNARVVEFRPADQSREVKN